MDAELNRELEQWNEMFRTDAVKFCLENNFNAGFFEGSDNNIVVDAYELKVIFVISFVHLLWSFIAGTLSQD